MLDLNLYNIANRINNFIKYNINYKKLDVYKCIYKMYIEKLLHGIDYDLTNEQISKLLEIQRNLRF